MCRNATFEVPAEPRSVPATREFCRATLTVWDLAELVEDAVLLLSELVTNGLMHAGPPLRVAVSIDAAGLELAVSDGSTSPPTVRPLRDDLDGDLEALGADATNDGIVDDRDPRLDVGAAGSVVGGRGMQLVVSLAGDWGVDRSGHGKSVWARLPLPPRWSEATGCSCATRSTSPYGRAVGDEGGHAGEEFPDERPAQAGEEPVGRPLQR